MRNAPMLCHVLLLSVFCGGLCLATGFDAHAQSPASQIPPPPAVVSAAPADRVVAVDASLKVDGENTRLSFRLSRNVSVDYFVMQEPDRVVIALPEVNFQLPASTGRKGAGIITGYRYGLFAPGRSRIVIDLAGPARISGLLTQEISPGIHVLEVELQRDDRAAFAASVKSTSGKAAVASAPVVSASAVSSPAAKEITKDKRPVIVIDPGHGGVDPGAVAGTVAEKTIVLAFAQKLRDIVGKQYRVVMTRDDDRFVTLADRVGIARVNSADLFISIHADSLSQAQNVRGATIYTASERATDLESARLAARENQADSLAGAETPIADREDVADILMDLAKRETRLFSSAIATKLVSEMGGSIKLHRIPKRAAGFRVLSAPDVPSVLIELGYVTSAKDIELLTSELWREAAALSVKRAIDGFFDIKTGKVKRLPGSQDVMEAQVP